MVFVGGRSAVLYVLVHDATRLDAGSRRTRIGRFLSQQSRHGDRYASASSFFRSIARAVEKMTAIYCFSTSASEAPSTRDSLFHLGEARRARGRQFYQIPRPRRVDAMRMRLAHARRVVRTFRWFLECVPRASPPLLVAWANWTANLASRLFFRARSPCVRPICWRKASGIVKC